MSDAIFLKPGKTVAKVTALGEQVVTNDQESHEVLCSILCELRKITMLLVEGFDIDEPDEDDVGDKIED